MNYRGVTDLKTEIRGLAHDIPAEVDLIVGIPRSGLLAANLLSLYLDLPMTDVDGLCRREFVATGNRYDQTTSFEDVDTALVFDDSVFTGSQMRETQQRLSGEELPFDLTYGAVYVTRTSHTYVDHWGEIVPGPRVFEWNLMHHDKLSDICVDVDGVLSRDPAPVESGDTEDYRALLGEVEPTIVPNNRIGWLVSSRPERYRAETEAWLDEHGFEYENLVMMDRASAGARGGSDDLAAYKASVYEGTDAVLFIESSRPQAVEIRERTGKPVYCYESNEMLQSGTIDELSRKSTELLSEFRTRPIDFSQSAGRYVLRRFSSRLQRAASRLD